MRVYVREDRPTLYDLNKLKFIGVTDKGYSVFDSYPLTSWMLEGLEREVLCGAEIDELCIRYCLNEEEFYKAVGKVYYFYKAKELRDYAQKLLDKADEYDKKGTYYEHKTTE